MSEDASISASKPKLTIATAGSILRLARIGIVGAFAALVSAELAGVHWPFNLITPYTPQLGVAAVVGALMLIGLKWRMHRTWRQDRLFLSVAILVALYAGAITFGLVPWRVALPAQRVATTDANLARIKVLSANVHTSNRNHTAILDLIRAEDPDIILLMELNTSWVNDLRSLKEKYPTSRTLPDESGNFGIGIWTRLEVDEAQVVSMLDKEDQLSRFDVPQIDATLDVRDANNPEIKHRIRFIGLHPLPPMNRTMSRARDAVIARAANSIAEKSSMPTVVAGDLNLTRYCRMIRRMTGPARLSDAASPIRFSWPNTWSRWAMGIRIDHTLVTDHWRVVDVHVGPDIGSDHMPIISTLQLVRTPK